LGDLIYRSMTAAEAEKDARRLKGFGPDFYG